jgi:hypothetical protein
LFYTNKVLKIKIQIKKNSLFINPQVSTLISTPLLLSFLMTSAASTQRRTPPTIPFLSYIPGDVAQVKDFIFLLDYMQAIKKSLLQSTGTSWKAYKLLGGMGEGANYDLEAETIDDDLRQRQNGASFNPGAGNPGNAQTTINKHLTPPKQLAALKPGCYQAAQHQTTMEGRKANRYKAATQRDTQDKIIQRLKHRGKGTCS